MAKTAAAAPANEKRAARNPIGADLPFRVASTTTVSDSSGALAAGSAAFSRFLRFSSFIPRLCSGVVRFF